MFEEKPKDQCESASRPTSERVYWCAPCSTRVARESDLIDISGTFTNPAGETFKVARFHHANVIVTGEPTLEATWFPGFAWSYAHCANCRAHLGWRYESSDGHFVGL